MMADQEKRRRFERALHYAGDTHAVEDVIAKVREGRAQYWGDDEASVVTEVLSYPRLKAVNLWLVSGELQRCLALEGEIFDWARDNGCTVATATGRRGWLRIAPTVGWKLRAFQFYKPLGGMPL
jgi:hypothetical protein